MSTRRRASLEGGWVGDGQKVPHKGEDELDELPVLR